MKILILSVLVVLESIALVPPKGDTLWGPLPQNYKNTYLAPAKKLKAALDKNDLKVLESIASASVYRDYALFYRAKILANQKNFSQAIQQLNVLETTFPSHPLEERAKELLVHCELGKAQALATNPKLKDAALELFRRGFSRISTKRWTEFDAALNSWYQLEKKGTSFEVEAFLTELYIALPADHSLKTTLSKDFPKQLVEKISKLPRTRSLLGNSTVKAIYPDQQLMDEGLSLVLEEKWSEAITKFQQLPKDYPDSDHLDRALFWEAKCLDKLGNSNEAISKYKILYEKYPLGYYGLQAALRTNQNIKSSVNEQALAPTPIEAVFVPRQLKAYLRTRALIESKATELSRKEAEFLFNMRPTGTTLGQDSASSSLALADFYYQAGFYLGAFTQFYSAIIADKGAINYNSLQINYPNLFDKEVKEAANAYELDPLVVLSLTKQESAFLPDAVSKSDAIGLMQIIMPTAKEIDATLDREDLLTPAKNLRAGSSYLRSLLDKYQGNLALALAAYNAGPHRASQWQKKMLEYKIMKKEFDVDLFIDTIPFTETRRYVSSILRNLAWYRTLEKREIPKTVQELAFQWRSIASKP